MTVYGECIQCHGRLDKKGLAGGVYQSKFVEVVLTFLDEKPKITGIEITNGVCKECAKIATGTYRPHRKGGE